MTKKATYSILAALLCVVVLFSSFVQFHHHHGDGSICIALFSGNHDELDSVHHGDDDHDNICCHHEQNDDSRDCDDDYGCGLHISDYDYVASQPFDFLPCFVIVSDPLEGVFDFDTQAEKVTTLYSDNYTPPPLCRCQSLRAPPCIA